jgi:hypothetical protein
MGYGFITKYVGWTISARREISRKIMRRGIASGELRAGLEPDIVLGVLYGPLYRRLLLPYHGDGVHLSDAYIDALIDTVFGGLVRKRIAN